MSTFQIGATPAKGVLNLRAHSGLEWQFRWGDGSEPFPAGAQVYLLLGDEDNPSVRWDFTLLGALATLVVPVDDARGVDNRTPFYLMFRQSAAAEPTCIGQGIVKSWRVG